MSYTDKKITQEEINAHHVQGATDYLMGNPQQNKAVFDDLPEFIAGKFNDLIDEIAGQHGDEIREAVDEWLAEHPEVTTTVQDNSLTTAKYVDGSVTPAKLDRTYTTPNDLLEVNANLTTEINVLDARMDEFASLPEGSTSGDAELLDIRVGADGVTYPSAGGAVRKQVGDLKSDITQMDSILIDTSISLNRYDYSLVTSETISENKRLYGDGTLRDYEGSDVSPYLEIEANTQYTAGLVPAYGDAKFPSYDLSVAMEFYDDTKTYISRINQANEPITFTTPANAKYYRFSLRKGVGVTVPLVNSRFMLVYGDTLPTTFSAYTGDSKTPKYGLPIEYSLSSGILTVTSKYGEGNIVVEFGKRGPNNLPDFRYITAEGRQKYSNSTDWFSPYLMSAANNADGDDASNRTYTGGNHNYNNTGSMDSSATARNLSLKYYADGVELKADGSGFCSALTIEWTNRVQGYNTRKSDGSGREILEERMRMTFDGIEWEVYREIQPLEDIFCDAFYGFQCAMGQYGTIYMIGATYRLPFDYTSPHNSGNNTPNIYVAHDTNDRLEMEVDRSLDLGKGILYGSSGTEGFRTAGSKGYSYLISQKNLSEDSIYATRGWYRFMPSY